MREGSGAYGTWRSTGKLKFLHDDKGRHCKVLVENPSNDILRYLVSGSTRRLRVTAPFDGVAIKRLPRKEDVLSLSFM